MNYITVELRVTVF